MSPQYEAIEKPRFVVEALDGTEQIVIRAPRNIFLILFLPIWLCGWTFAGASAINALLFKSASPFLLLWLCGWAFGEVFAISTLSWMLFGKEFIQVTGSDLEIGRRMLGLTRRRLFQGREIRDLSSTTPQLFSYYNQRLPAFWTHSKTGSIKFTYGARTIYAAESLDEPEGRLIVERLRKRLPPAATARP